MLENKKHNTLNISVLVNPGKRFRRYASFSYHDIYETIYLE